MEELWTPSEGGPTCRLVARDDHEAVGREIVRLVPGFAGRDEHELELTHPELRHGDGGTVLVVFTTDDQLDPVRWELIASEAGVLAVGDPALAPKLREVVEHLAPSGPPAMLAAIVTGLAKSVLSALDRASDYARNPERTLMRGQDRRARLRDRRARLFMLQELFATQSELLKELQDDDSSNKVAGHAVRRSREAFQQASSTAARLYAQAGDVLTEESAVVNERLTLVSTIFLPLTVTTGFFGMNFGWMVDRIGSPMTFALLGVVFPAVVSAVTIALVRRWGAGRT